jgi:hypothetical protein
VWVEAAVVAAFLDIFRLKKLYGYFFFLINCSCKTCVVNFMVGVDVNGYIVMSE